MKTAELTGALLDYWVARALGLRVEARYRNEVRREITVLVEGNITRGIPHYSTDWSQGGPIIEQKGITIHFCDDFGGKWRAGMVIWLPDHDDWKYGDNALIAAMRAYVSSVYGDEVSTDNADSEGEKGCE